MNRLAAPLSVRPTAGTTRTIPAHTREASARTASPILVIANDNDVHTRYTTTAADVLAGVGIALIGLTGAVAIFLLTAPVEVVRWMRGAR